MCKSKNKLPLRARGRPTPRRSRRWPALDRPRCRRGASRGGRSHAPPLSSTPCFVKGNQLGIEHPLVCHKGNQRGSIAREVGARKPGASAECRSAPVRPPALVTPRCCGRPLKLHGDQQEIVAGRPWGGGAAQPGLARRMAVASTVCRRPSNHAPMLRERPASVAGHNRVASSCNGTATTRNSSSA